MMTLATAQDWAMLALGVVLLGVEIFALFEAVRGSAASYVAHGKLTKPAWVGITAFAVLLGFIGLAAPVSLPGVAGVIAAGIFLADVRPVVRPGRRNDGPYGPW